MTGNELRAEDYISSVLIGAWTQRRGNFAREVDLGNRIQELRSTLEFVELILRIQSLVLHLLAIQICLELD